MDIAELGIKIDSRDADAANQALQQLAKTGKDAEKSAGEVTRAYQVKAQTMKMTTRDAELYKLAMGGATSEQIRNARTALDSVEAHERLQQKMKDYRQLGHDIGSAIKTGFVVATAAVGAFYAFWEHSIGKIADYQDVAEKSGIADPASLAAMRTALDVAGSSVDSFATSLNQMQKQLARGSDESKGAARALKQIGIEIDDFRKLDPVTQWKTVATALDGVADSGGKVALMQDIMGRGAAAQLPAMKEWVASGDSIVKVTNDMIAGADEWKDANARSISEMRQFLEVSSTLALPTMTALRNAAFEFSKSLLGISEASDEVGRNKAISEFAEAMGGKIAAFADIVVGVVSTVKNLGLGLGSLGAAMATFLSADITSQESLASAGRQIRQIWADYNSDVAKSREGKTISTLYKEELEKIKDAAIKTTGDIARADRAAPKLNVSGYTGSDPKDKKGDAAAKKAAREAEQEERAYKNLRDAIIAKNEAVNDEIGLGRKRTEAEKWFDDTQNKITSSTSKLTTAHKNELLALAGKTAKRMEDQAAAAKSLKTYIELWQAQERYRQEMIDNDVEMSKAGEQRGVQDFERLEQLREEKEILQLQTGMIGESNTEIGKAIDLRKIELEYDRELWKINHDMLLTEEAKVKARQDLIAIRDAKTELAGMGARKAESEQLWNDFRQLGSDAWDVLAEKGGDTFKSLGNLAKRYIGNALKNLSLNIAMNIAAGGAGGGVAGAMGGGGAQGSGGTSLLSSGASLLGAGGMFGAGGLSGAMMGGAGWLTGATTLGGSLGAAGSLMGSGTMAGAMAGGAMALGAVIPIVGALYAAYKIFSKKKGGEKEGGYFGEDIGAAIGRADKLNPEIAAGAKQTLANMNALLQSTARALGGNASGIGFGIGVSTDPKGTAPSFLEVNAVRNGSVIAQSVNREIGRTPEALAEAMATQTAEMMLAALEKSGIDRQYIDYFNRITAGMEAEAKMGAFEAIVQMARLTDAIKDTGAVFAGLGSTTIDTKARIAEFACGMENLMGGMAAYMQMLPESVRRQAQLNAMSRTLAAGGVNISGADLGTVSRDKFIETVNSLQSKMQANAGDEGAQRAFAALMSIAGAFAELTEETDKTERNIITLEDAQSKLNDAYENQLGILEDAKQKWDDLSRSLKDAQNNLKLNDALSPLTPQQRYEEAAQQLAITRAQALSGDTNAAAKLEGMITNWLTLSRTMFASSEQYQNDYARGLQMLADVEASSLGRAEDAANNIDLLKQQVSGLIDIKTAVQSVEAAITLLHRVKSGEVVVEGVPLATGMARVPFNNFPALLHADETVLNPQQANAFRSFPDMISELRALRSEVSRLRSQSQAGTGAQLDALYDATARAAAQTASASIEAARRTVYARKTSPILQ